ncbi:MAG: hypothetical protein QM662_05490 [Gordonia sp. (in: high G+C Gram-positive bacteria)]
MGLFRRRRSSALPPAAGGAPDPVFDGIGVDEVAWIRAQAQAVLAGHGVEVTVDDTGTDLLGADGRRLALDNVVAACRQSPHADWQAIISHHFGTLARLSPPPTVDELTPSQLLAQIRTRILPVGSLRHYDIDLSRYSRPVADDLEAVLCLDFPEMVSYLDGDRAEKLDLDLLFRVGQANTDAEPLDSVDSDGSIAVVTGNSVFTSSKVLNMARLTAQVFGQDAPYGVVFAVPNRNVTIMHLISSVDAVLTIGTIAQLAGELSADGGWPVSPNVYHWYRDRITRISALDLPDRVTIMPSPDLTDILNHLSERDQT